MTQATLTKKDLACSIYMDVGLPISEATKMIDEIIEIFSNGIRKDGYVKIVNFGSFYLRKKKARVGRNPKTKKEAVISERTVVSFYASKALKYKMLK